MSVTGKIKQGLKKMLSLLGTKNVIVFESVPDLSDNTKPVFDELVRRGYNKKYKMVWLCIKPPRDDFPVLKNVKYVDCTKHHLLSRYYTFFCKAAISCNRFVPTERAGQKSFYLTHGSPFKNVSDFYACPDEMDYMVTPSEYMNDKLAGALKFDVTRAVPLGFPRNDDFAGEKLDLSAYFGTYSKYVIWYPTVKQYKSGKTLNVKPIPFLDEEETIKKLDEAARSLDVLVIVKPHFAQVTENLKRVALHNLVFIDDAFYHDRKISPYRFVGSCDALLTDYSSVFYDFLLADKPIGFIWEDFAEFEREMGFYECYKETTVCGEKIYSADDLIRFLKNVSEGNDTLKEERAKVSKLANRSDDGKNAARVADFVIEKAGLTL